MSAPCSLDLEDYWSTLRGPAPPTRAIDVLGALDRVGAIVAELAAQYDEGRPVDRDRIIEPCREVELVYSRWRTAVRLPEPTAESLSLMPGRHAAMADVARWIGWATYPREIADLCNAAGGEPIDWPPNPRPDHIYLPPATWAAADGEREDDWIAELMASLVRTEAGVLPWHGGFLPGPLPAVLAAVWLGRSGRWRDYRSRIVPAAVDLCARLERAGGPVQPSQFEVEVSESCPSSHAGDGHAIDPASISPLTTGIEDDGGIVLVVRCRRCGRAGRVAIDGGMVAWSGEEVAS